MNFVAEGDLLQHVIADFGADRELNLGELPLEIGVCLYRGNRVTERSATESKRSRGALITFCSR